MSALICGATHSSKRTHRGHFVKSQCCGSAIKNQMAASHVATSMTMTAQRMILPHMKRIITRKRPATDGRRHGPLLPQQIAMVNDLPSFINTPCCISSVVRWCNTGSIRRCCTSIARLVAINQLATYSNLAHAPNYIDRCAPPIKFSLLRRLSVIIRS
jgi:hypothetical protein